MAVYLQLPLPPPTDGLWLFTQEKKVPNWLNKYYKQEVIMGKLLQLQFIGHLSKRKIDLSVYIRCDTDYVS